MGTSQSYSSDYTDGDNHDRVEYNARPVPRRLAARRRGTEFLVRSSSSSLVVQAATRESSLQQITDFAPVPDPHWMGRSIETLILGHSIRAPILTASSPADPEQNSASLEAPDDEPSSRPGEGSSSSFDNSSFEWARHSSLSTRGSLDYRRGSSSIRHGGTLAQYLSNPSRRTPHTLRQRRSGSSHHRSAPKQGPNICFSLLARELTGHQPRGTHVARLEQLSGSTLIQRVDHYSAGIVTEVEMLSKAVDRGDWTDTCSRVSRLTPRLIGDPSRSISANDPTLPSFASAHFAGGGRLGLERDTFVLAGGVELYLRLFRETSFVGNHLANNDARHLSKSLVSNKLSLCWNEVLASLRELVYAMPVLVENGTLMDQGRMVPFLFTLLSHEACFDAAATLLEEILSLQSHAPPTPAPPEQSRVDTEYRSMTWVVPVTTFFLGNVPNLYALWRGFNCRQLAHFCRILALLIFEPEDRQLLESPSVLKSLELLQLRRDRAARAGRDATVDMNQAILLGDNILMTRLLKLLKVMNYAPTLRRTTAYHVMIHFPFISETLIMLGLTEMGNWLDIDQLDIQARKIQESDQNLSDLGSVATMLESLSGFLQNNSTEPATQLGHIIHIINAAQQAGVVMGRRRQQQGIHVASVPLESPSLDSLESAAMTLSDQVGMQRELNGDATEEENLLLSIEIPEAPPERSSQEASSRPRIASPEEAANELQFNGLLLAPYQVEVLFVLCTLLGGRRKIDTQQWLNDNGLISIMDDMFHRLSFGRQTESRSISRSSTDDISGGDDSSDGEAENPPSGIHGPGCECTPESALSVQYLRLLHNFCDRDCDNYAGRRLLLSKEEREYVFSTQHWHESDRPANLRRGLFSKVVGAFLQEPDDSQYRFWLASCAESYLRGSSPQEQLFAAKSGLLVHLVADVISDRLHCAGSLQTSFDLLGELCKCNPEVLNLLVSSLDEDDFRKFMSAAASNLVDSNVFLRSLLLTVERIASARLFESDISHPSNPWKDHEFAPWTGKSGPDSRYYLTHSWWDAPVKVLPDNANKQTQEKFVVPGEIECDEARSTDWFPPGCRLDRSTALGASTQSNQGAPFSSAVMGYNGWLFSPPTMGIQLQAYDPMAWVLRDAAFLPNTIERLSWFLITNQSRLLRDLLCVVDLTNINHENICCLNTAVVIVIFAERRHQLSDVLRDLKKMNQEDHEAAVRRRDARRAKDFSEASLVNATKLLDINDDRSPRLLRQMSSRLSDRTDVLCNFRELLWFWSEYYTHRGRDRLSLEFSSHMRFHEWHKVVTMLTQDDGSSTALVRKPVRLPKSPYKRSARIVDNPRRAG